MVCKLRFVIDIIGYSLWLIYVYKPSNNGSYFLRINVNTLLRKKVILRGKL